MVEAAKPGPKQTPEERQKRIEEFPYYAAGGCGTEFMNQFLNMTDAEAGAMLAETEAEMDAAVAALTPERKRETEGFLEKLRKTPI